MSRSRFLYEGVAAGDGIPAAEIPAAPGRRRAGEGSRPLPLKRTAAPLAFARALTNNRPAVAWSLALLFVFKGAIGLAAVISPVSASQPTRLIAIVSVLATLLGCGIWLFGERIPVWGFPLLAALGALAASGLVARAATPGGVMLTAFSYPWIAIYAAHFFARRVVVVLGTLITAAFGAGLLIDGLPHAGLYWVVVAATTWSICFVMGELSDNLRRQADTDPLTGLLNRSGFLAAAEREHGIAQRTGSALAVAVLDLDGFKQINDMHGHGVGDRLLVDLGRSWLQRLRAGDILARHGGDEFVLLLPSTSVEGAQAVLDRLRDESLPVKWSSGVCVWSADEILDECLARADRRLYRAKNAMRVHDARPAAAERALAGGV